jgi:hypothetical protein
MKSLVKRPNVAKRKRKILLVERPAPVGELTCADLAGDLVGSFRGGPRDLSTNKRHLEEAIVAESTIKRTVKAYGKTLRRLASGPRRTKKA